MDGDNPDETFPPTNGRVFGIIALVVGVGVTVLGLVEGAWVLAAVGLLFAGISWASLLRPRVAIEDDALVLRNMVDTVRIPLAAVEEVVVRQVLAVRVGEKRYTSPAVGRPRRQMSKEDLRLGKDAEDLGLGERAFGLFVQERIRERAKAARERLGIRIASKEQDALATQVVREPAVPEIAWLAGSLVALVVAVIL
ncbi:hypothetical protein [Nocardioides sp.]|uniref:hypothetical protein n=1 Tax=Nocardioides sp. TaxID=35761 RepID=UPI00271BC4DB|nr:hypothetical protein [Nocardioides sp.]MDO9456727.1 hypothetical protein [Nocardioides sp.]